jgi:hypothetical protein
MPFRDAKNITADVTVSGIRSTPNVWREVVVVGVEPRKFVINSLAAKMIPDMNVSPI